MAAKDYSRPLPPKRVASWFRAVGGFKVGFRMSEEDEATVRDESEPTAEDQPQPEDQQQHPRSSKSPKHVNLPISRIKQIIKMDPEVHLASMDSVFLIAKAAEMFIETLTKDAFSYTLSAKKKTVQRRDVDSAIANAESLIFLEGTLDL